MKSFDNAVLYSDNHLLVAVKGAGILTQPDPTERNSLEEFAKEWVKKQYHKKGAVFLHVLHRLDRPVSGLVLFARTSKALSRLNEQQRNQEIQRIYIAEVEGILPAREGVLDHFLIHKAHRAEVAKEGESQAKHARLFYRVLSFQEHTTRVEIELETGRYHQIRCQFGAIGHPVVKDGRYGARQPDANEIHLHCKELSFQHPITKEILKFQSPPFF